MPFCSYMNVFDRYSKYSETSVSEHSSVPPSEFCWFHTPPLLSPLGSECERIFSVPTVFDDLINVNIDRKRHLRKLDDWSDWHETPNKNNLSVPNYGPKKFDWLNCLSLEILSVETAMQNNLIGRISDHHQTITQHEKRDFNVSYKKCFFLTLRTYYQSIKQTIFRCKTLFYEKENIIK